jgi:hypothetical protein
MSVNEYSQFEDHAEALAYLGERQSEIFGELMNEIDNYIEAVYPDYTLHQQTVSKFLVLKQTYTELVQQINRKIDELEQILLQSGFFE